ncbi:MAG: putative bifunctional diguanylate cyclase/phosphodiesterase [Hyphomicrobiaceae bacterium]
MLASKAELLAAIAAALTLEAPGPLALVTVGVDNFKAVSSNLGHSLSGVLHRQVLQRAAALASSDWQVTDCGPGELALLMPGSSVEEACAFARHLIGTLGRTHLVAGQIVDITASAGVACMDAARTASTDAAKTVETLVKWSDLALVQARSGGRSTICTFDAAIEAQFESRRELEADLRKALGLRQLDVAYQPVARISTGRIEYVEALARWNHPVRGSVSPSEFIPIAETLGLIVPIGEWVLRTACAEAAGWPAHVHLAVNVSPLQFLHGRLLTAVATALAATGLEADRLVLEITESALLDNTAANIEVLRALRARGVRIALDDFGTGYSSLSYLRSFPFDKIKIDQSFVRELIGRRDNEAIVRAIISLGAPLDMETVAEGVETAEHLAWLKREGCHFAQGYCISRPLPGAGLRHFLDHWGTEEMARLSR